MDRTWISCIVGRFFYHWVTREALLIFGVSIFSLEDKNGDNCPFEGLVTEINYLPFLQMSLKIKFFFKLNSVITHPRNTSRLTMTIYKTLKPQIHTDFTIPISVHSYLQDEILWFTNMACKNRGKCPLESYLNLTSIMVI